VALLTSVDESVEPLLIGGNNETPQGTHSLTGSRHATTLCVNYPLWVSQLGQLSLPSLQGWKMRVICVFTWITQVETIKAADYTYGYMATEQSPLPAAGGPVCDNSAAEAAYAAIVAPHK